MVFLESFHFIQDVNDKAFDHLVGLSSCRSLWLTFKLKLQSCVENFLFVSYPSFLETIFLISLSSFFRSWHRFSETLHKFLRKGGNDFLNAALNSGILIMYNQGSEIALQYEITAMQIHTFLTVGLTHNSISCVSSWMKLYVVTMVVRYQIVLSVFHKDVPFPWPE